jgi:DeoR/GlpR family transcriptional regulator of sugar metabolism
MKRALMASAAETHVLASAEKIGAASAYVICPLADVDGIVAAADIPKKTLADYRKLGLSIVQV